MSKYCPAPYIYWLIINYLNINGISRQICFSVGVFECASADKLVPGAHAQGYG
jgi:hypothetical protein